MLCAMQAADQLRHTPYGNSYFGNKCQSPLSPTVYLHVHKGTTVVSVNEDFVLETTKYYCPF